MTEAELEIANKAFQKLAGQPLSDIWRVFDLLYFFFGPQRQEINKRGREHWTSDWKLSVVCPWELTQINGFRLTEAAIPQDASPLSDETVDILQNLNLEKTLVETVAVEGDGRILMKLSEGIRLSVIPSPLLIGDQWSLMLIDRTVMYELDEQLGFRLDQIFLH